MEQVAIAYPESKIELIGEVSDPSVFEKLRKYPNIIFLGEVPYSQLPGYLSNWGVAIIPFVVNKLTLATNPVKMYEYSAAGIPTVATALPEIISAANDLEGIFISSDSEMFVKNISRARLCSPETLNNLKSWAKTQEWSSRFDALEMVMQDDIKVTVIVLMWNNADLTIRCLDSLVNRGDYGTLEIIVVDNDSEPLESKKVQNWCDSNSGQCFVYIRNEANYGFAKGMNIGIKRSTGEYVVLLNNDTVVTPGWIHRSLRHFRDNPGLGLLGPSTDNSGNDAYVKIKFMSENWEEESFTRFAFRESRLLERTNLAFFCTFIPRSVIENVGLLDESFGRGYFEDDDYCKRVLIEGYSIGIARDVFVHHEMDASFSKLGNQEKIDLFNENRIRFESKWGKWTPHSYSMDKDQW
jgi:GT2 family glycosyltransferase